MRNLNSDYIKNDNLIKKKGLYEQSKVLFIMYVLCK